MTLYYLINLLCIITPLKLLLVMKKITFLTSIYLLSLTAFCQIDSTQLIGYWYSDSEEQFLDFDSDSLNVYDLFAEDSCIELGFSSAYNFNDSLIFVTIEDSTFPTLYFLQNQSLTVISEDTMVYSLVDSIPFELCNDNFDSDSTSWSCVDGDCETDENGEYSSFLECELACQSPTDSSQFIGY